MSAIHSSSKLAKVYADRARMFAFLRQAHILLTGVPDPDTPLKETTPLKLFAVDFTWLLAFTGLSVAGTYAAGTGGLAIIPGIVLILIGMLGATGRLRRIMVGHVHETSHGIAARLYRKRGDSKKLARWKAEFILDFGSVLTFTQNGQAYRREHARHHTFAKLGTVRDPDGSLLFDWGIWPTKTDRLYAALMRKILNPLWHLDFFWRRVRSNLMDGKPYRRALGALGLTALTGSAFIMPLPVWLVAVFLPFGPLLHTASLLQVITEHPYGAEKPATSLEEYAALNWERIPWTPMPDAGSPVMAWVRWSRDLMVHIVSRLAVLDDAIIGHAYHHLAWPIGRPFLDWFNTMGHFVRAVEDGVLPPGVDDRIVEGLKGALGRQKAYFKTLRGD